MTLFSLHRYTLKNSVSMMATSSSCFIQAPGHAHAYYWEHKTKSGASGGDDPLVMIMTLEKDSESEM